MEAVQVVLAFLGTLLLLLELLVARVVRGQLESAQRTRVCLQKRKTTYLMSVLLIHKLLPLLMEPYYHLHEEIKFIVKNHTLMALITMAMLIGDTVGCQYEIRLRENSRRKSVGKRSGK